MAEPLDAGVTVIKNVLSCHGILTFFTFRTTFSGTFFGSVSVGKEDICSARNEYQTVVGLVSHTNFFDNGSRVEVLVGCLGCLGCSVCCHAKKA